MLIYCCACAKNVDARLVDGTIIYPHRSDLHDIPFWRCEGCKNFVGCHHKTKNRTKPLGCIANDEIKNARKHIHKLLDSMWMGYQNWKLKRNAIYEGLSEYLGYAYHTANIRDIETARKVYRWLLNFKKECGLK